MYFGFRIILLYLCMTIHKFYTLEHPITNEIRYVGVTTSKLATRLSGHIWDAKNKQTKKAKWINSLLRQGLRPKIVYLDECEENIWETIERYYISQFICWGFKLTNLDDGGRGSILYRKDRHLDGLIRSSLAHEKEIHCYSKSGDYIKTYRSIRIAALFLNKKDNTITECLHGRSKSAGGFVWSFIKNDKIQTKEFKITPRTKLIASKDDTTLEFACVKHAEKFFKVGRNRLINAIEKQSLINNYEIKYKDIV